jgi:hypothetical protein
MNRLNWRNNWGRAVRSAAKRLLPRPT